MSRRNTVEKEWSDAEIEYLTNAWVDKAQSSAKIGREMGRSKNSIVGKAGRLGLPSRPSPIARYYSETGERTPAPPRPPKPAKAPKRTLPKLQSADMPEPPKVTLAKKPVFKAPPAVPPQPLFRKLTECTWPIGHPKAKDFRYCDGPSLPGKSYCQTHYDRAYTKTAAA